MNGIKRSIASLCALLTILPSSQTSLAESSRQAAQVHTVYVGSFGSSPDAIYLRNKLCSKLEKLRRIVVVNDPGSAAVVLTGSAAMRPVGHYALNARSRYRMGRSVAVYDAKMAVEVDDSQGRSLWSGRLKPRFWGSQYVSDNVVNQAARHVTDVLR